MPKQGGRHDTRDRCRFRRLSECRTTLTELALTSNVAFGSDVLGSAPAARRSRLPCRPESYSLVLAMDTRCGHRTRYPVTQAYQGRPSASVRPFNRPHGCLHVVVDTEGAASSLSGRLDQRHRQIRPHLRHSVGFQESAAPVNCYSRAAICCTLADALAGCRTRRSPGTRTPRYPTRHRPGRVPVRRPAPGGTHRASIVAS